MPRNPELAAVMVVGDSRARAQEALDALYAQTIADRIEVVVIDLKKTDVPELTMSSRVTTTYVTLGSSATWAHARAVAVTHATAPIVAFIEDHCTADPAWAEALVRAYASGWAAVGYAFTNPHGDVYVARAILAAEYGAWAHPTRARRARVLPNGNVSYRRDLLMALGPDLETLLTPDFGLHEQFNRQGLAMYIDADARVAHDSLGTLPNLATASFLFCRILGARRAETQHWSRAKRLAYGLATPVVSPAIALWRAFANSAQTAAGRLALVGYLPVLLVKNVSSAVGESVGYFAGMGPQTETEFGEWELHIQRTPKS